MCHLNNTAAANIYTTPMFIFESMWFFDPNFSHMSNFSTRAVTEPHGICWVLAPSSKLNTPSGTTRSRRSGSSNCQQLCRPFVVKQFRLRLKITVTLVSFTTDELKRVSLIFSHCVFCGTGFSEGFVSISHICLVRSTRSRAYLLVFRKELLGNKN